ncbi:MAG TPA: pantoate--beta-alanine ligase [Sphingomicrobium sp.]|nr:pantoate--beta-alanine ligase [Sphingomicrobium sp.]
MQTVRSSEELARAVAELRQSGTLALVPTMGALHAGHIALIDEAKRRAERVVATIFVNPTQFNDKDDLARYPRQEPEDVAKLKAAGCDLLWTPSVDDIYPAGFATSVHVSGISDRWEGEHRPGHFDGVATVVAKLLLSVHPDIAFFGEKDFQQLAVIRRMATDLNLGVEIAGVSTVRDPDGLALSSRNALLSPSDREKAGGLLSTLADLGGAITRGATVGPAIERAIENLIRNGFEPVDYVAYVDGGTLEPLDEYQEGGRLIAAAFLGGVRLIDNISV